MSNVTSLAARALAEWPELPPTAYAERSDRGVWMLWVALTVLSIGFFASVTVVASLDPGYFDRLLLANAEEEVDPIQVGSTEKAPEEGVAAMPVPTLIRLPPLQPKDFQIVMIYGHEAHLATLNELWYVRVGSIIPGLGRILAIEPGANGGTVKAEHATLTGIARR